MPVPFPMLVPLIAAAALFMENMDSTVIATSLPQMAADLHEDPVILKLAFTSYLIALAVFIPISGWSADRFGARNVFRAAIVVFTLASAACGFATNLEELILARAIQGIGGAMMTPVGRLILLRSVPKQELVRALAWLTVPALVAPLVGPPLGGFITTYFHWRWIFWINIPFGIAGVLLATAFMPEVRAPHPKPLDYVGFFLSGAGLSSLIFGLTVVGRDLFPAWVAPALSATGAVLIALYVWHAYHRAHPILNLRLLGIETFRSSVTGGTLFRIGVGAIPFLLPLMLQVGFGLNAFASGSLTFAAAAGALMMKFSARPILKQLGFRTVLVVNAFICSAFLAVYALFTPATPHALIVAVLVASGFFRSLQFTSLNALAFSDIPDDRMSEAATVSAVAQQLSSAFGVALAAFILEGARSWRGDPALQPADFSIAFLSIAVFTSIAGFMHLRLSPHAGSVVSGRELKPKS
ncbi:MAG: DHA2 family efflux MFS transporter permease subunit [Hyphomicrobiales bacterium]